MNNRSQYLIFTSFIFILVISVVWGCRFFCRQTSPIALQKAILKATKNEERQKILSRLDQYYLSMFIPDSIRRHVQAEVDTLIKHQERTNPLIIINKKIGTNIYQVEEQLNGILRAATIAHVRKENDTFQMIISYAKILADSVDNGTEKVYWRPWVDEVRNFSPDRAMNWLMANVAQQRCSQIHLTKFIEAEKYGALGLQLLNGIQDIRLYLDIQQRLMTILYKFYGSYDLSSQFAQHAYQEACKLKYYLRANGILYNHGEVLHLAGKNDSALATFGKTVSESEKYDQIPNMSWYKKNGLLGVARSNWQLGNYEKSLAVCAQVEKFDLQAREQILLHITKGIAYRSLGNYDAAEQEYNQSLSLSIKNEDWENHIQILRNLGTMHYRLTEYDKANIYFNQAIKLLQDHSMNCIARQCELLICIAENKAAQNDIEQFNHFIKIANELIQQIDIPILKAEFLRSLGRLNMKFHHYEQAYKQLREAIHLYEYYGLIRAALETKNNYAECLIALKKYDEAQQLLNDILKCSNNIQDSQQKINATGMMAKTAELTGHLDKAIQYSNELIKEVEIVSDHFMGRDNLIVYRQKVHDYLKQAVVYEIRKERFDSAFIKLDYIKARIFKEKLDSWENKNPQVIRNPYWVDLNMLRKQLNPDQLIINYLVTQDTLFAFLLDQNDLKILKKSINIAVLENLVNAYVQSIHNSIDIFKNESPEVFLNHYQSNALLSQNLYRNLLGWQELQTRLRQNTITYIIPDDILYEVPFACLSNSFEKGQKFLIQQTAVTYLPGACFLQSNSNKSTDHNIHDKKVLLSINNQFPGTSELINYLKHCFRSTEELIVKSPQANLVDVLSTIGDKYAVCIFLGHGSVNRIFPDSSYIELVVVNETDNSTRIVKVTLSELKRIDWTGVEMVFLIGCETAEGKIYKGSGMAGIQQCFLACGAQVILASFWEIDAKNAIDQIIAFFKLWEKIKNPVVALQQVNINTIKKLETDNYYKKPHPYLWGSFTLLQSKNIFN